MRTVPVDADRVRMISTGSVSPVPLWVELSSGERRPDPNGRQQTDDEGRPLWRIEVIMPGDESDDRDRTNIVDVTVSAKDQPDVGSFGDVLAFDRLVMSLPYLNRRSGAMTTPRFSAEGVRKAGAKPGQQHAA